MQEKAAAKYSTRMQFRISFYESATVRLDPLEFAWILSKHGVEVVGISDNGLMLFVRARSIDAVTRFTNEINDLDGPLIFESVEYLGESGYEQFD